MFTNVDPVTSELYADLERQSRKIQEDALIRSVIVDEIGELSFFDSTKIVVGRFPDGTKTVSYNRKQILSMKWEGNDLTYYT